MPSEKNRKQPKLEEFVARYGGVYEHSPWVAEHAYLNVLDVEDVNELAAIFAGIVDGADDERKLALIRAHPDLAGKAAVKGELTEESTIEQAGAGIDQCTQEEYEQFRDLNSRYKGKFSFPFVIAVRGRNRQEILAAFESRLINNRQTEFETALREIHKIARLRLQEIVT